MNRGWRHLSEDVRDWDVSLGGRAVAGAGVVCTSQDASRVAESDLICKGECLWVNCKWCWPISASA